MNTSIAVSGSSDLRHLLVARSVRLFGYGLVSLILALYLTQLGLKEHEVGLLFSVALLGDVVTSLFVTTRADRMGRRRMLMLSSLLMIGAGLAFFASDNYVILMIAAIFGVIAPSDKDVGPFLSIEQASIGQIVGDRERTAVFGKYNLVGSLSVAFGALVCGWLVKIIQAQLPAIGDACRAIMLGYVVCGVGLFFLYRRLSQWVECPPREDEQARIPLRQSRPVVLKLSGLFALDSFAGGFIVQSMLAYWFHVRFGASTELLGSIFFGANILAGVSALLAARIAGRFGLINTMVFTHIPSSILLILIPFMPTLALAVTVLLLRFTISQMDVPTRQSYTVAVVPPSERAAAAGVTSVARSVGASLSPALAGQLFGIPSLISVPFFIAGGLKIIYDLLVYRSFKSLRPPGE